MLDILYEFLKLYGLKEITGKDSNPEIIKMFDEIGFKWVADDSTAWCSAALNFVCKKLGYERSNQLNARSWLKMSIVVLKPSIGDIVVFYRGDPKGWQGHVGLFINWDEKNIWVLGGNQSDSINITVYPRERLLGFRQVKKIV